MRRLLPIASLLVLAGLLALALLWHSIRTEPLAGERVHDPRAAQAESPADELARSDAPEERHAADSTLTDEAQPTYELDPQAGQLVVHVRGKATRKPIAHASVTAWTARAGNRDDPSGTTDIHEPLGNGETDAAGDVALEFRAQVPLSIDVTVLDSSAGNASISLPALRLGERRDLEVLLPDGNDARVFGKVVAASDGAAIGGARVRMMTARPGFSADHNQWGAVELAQAQTGSDGSFELDYPAWREPHLRVEAAGFGVKLAEPLKECSDAAHPLVIELARSAGLRAHLIGAEGLGLDALKVELIVDSSALIPEDQSNRGDVRASFWNEHWESTTDRGGWVSFVDLPAQTWITAYIHMGPRVIQPEGKGVELASGESREVEWRMGAGCALSGLLVDTEGAPVTRTQVWLTETWTGSVPFFSSGSKSSLQQIATTDVQGRFEMPGVPSGEWFLGPAPDGLHEANEQSVAPTAVRIVIGNERSKEVTLRVARGLYVRGRVLDPDGRPRSGALLGVEDDGHHMLETHCESKADGSFAIGPLPAQSLWIHAWGYRCVVSLPVRVQPGTDDVELRLRRGEVFRGRVVDEDSAAGCVATVVFTAEGSSAEAGDGSLVCGTDSEDDGTFESSPCLPGTYSIGAMTDDGRFGFVKSIELSAGGEHGDLLIKVKPGGKLHLTYSGSRDTVLARIRVDGALLGNEFLIRKDKRETIRMPAGASVLELSDDQGHVLRKEITLQAGETRELVVTDKE